MSEILSGLDGTVCIMDDVLVYGRCQEEHDHRLTAVLERLQQAKVTLNKDKRKFSVKSVRFLGHIIDNSGIHPDPQKLDAIQMLPTPKSASEVCRFLGMANQLGKFLPSLAEISKPLRSLLSKNNMWNWGELQEKAFQAVKKALSSSPVLAIYKPDSETAISADASSFGIGGILSQKQPNSPLPLLHVPSQPQSKDTHRLRKRHLLSPGLVRDLVTTFWGRPSISTQTTNR